MFPEKKARQKQRKRAVLQGDSMAADLGGRSDRAKGLGQVSGHASWTAGADVVTHNGSAGPRGAAGAMAGEDTSPMATW